MNDNVFLENPIKIHIVDPLLAPNYATKPLKTYVVMGPIPNKIKDAIAHKQAGSLLEYYGKSWREKLGMPGRVTGRAEAQNSLKTGQAEPPVEDMGDEFDISTQDLAEPIPKTVPNGPIEKPSYVVTDDATISDVLGLKVDDSDITPDLRPGPIIYVDSPAIYPEDKIRELKEKIFIITKIPPYRQHLYWYEGGDEAQAPTQPYRFYTDRVIDIDITQLRRGSGNELPINRELYANRAEIRIEALDEFRLLSGLSTYDFYVADLAQIIAQDRRYMQESLLADQYQFDLYYYGFICPFWPQITAEVFRAFLINEKALFTKYPQLAPMRHDLEERFQSESRIINDIYRKTGRIDISLRKIRATFAITHMIATPRAATPQINLRNLFDRLHVSRCVPEIHFRTKVAQNRYLIQKIHIKSENTISFPGVFNSGITMAISLRKMDQDNFHYRPTPLKPDQEQSRYLFLNIQANGRYFAKTIWNEEDEKNFNDILIIIKKFLDPLLAKINQFGREIFPEGGTLPLLTPENVSYQTINSSIFWKKILTETQFKALRAQLAPYIEAGIVHIRGTVSDFTFRKGMHNFDQAAILRNVRGHLAEVLRNQYAYLSNNDVSQRWAQFYSGRAVKIAHRTTDVAISVTGITETEFTTFFRYITHFIASILCSPEFQAGPARKSGPTGPPPKKIKKLKQFDPELYNLKKHGSKKTYSIKCQNPKQPLVYTEEEVQGLSAEERKRLYRYWNFTLNREAHYACPNKKFPHLFFMVGVHPKGYCMPCCKKSTDIPGSIKAQINKICADEHNYTGQMSRGQTAKHRHIVNYGRELDIGRAARIPAQLAPVFGQAAGQTSEEDGNILYILYGVQQGLPGIPNIGPIFSLANVLGITITALAREVIGALSSHPNLFYTVLHGQLLEYFHYPEDLLNILRELFVEEKLISGTAIRKLLLNRRSHIIWNGLFIEMAHILHGVATISIFDQSGPDLSTTGQTGGFTIRAETSLSTIDAAPDRTKICVLIWKENLCYPIYLVDTSNYFVTRKPLKKLFDKNDKFMQKVLKTFRTKYTTDLAQINIYLLAEFIKAQPEKQAEKYFIIEKYINRRGLCYGALLGFAPPENAQKLTKTFKPGRKATGPEMPEKEPVLGSFENIPGIILIHVALDQTDYTADGIMINFSPPNMKLHPCSPKSFSTFMDSYNKYIKNRGDNVHGPIELQTTIRGPSGQIEALIGRNGINLIEASPDKIVYELFGKIEEKTINYDLYAVNRAIMARCQPDPADDRANTTVRALYNHHLYHLFLAELVLYIKTHVRNESLRKKIIARAEKAEPSQRMRDPYAVIGDLPISADDREDLAEIIRGRPAEFKKALDARNWGFDSAIIEEFRAMPDDVLRAKLLKFAGECTIGADSAKINDMLKGVKFPNIYAPCGVGPENKKGEHIGYQIPPYCVSHKLVLPEGLLPKFVDILIYDIRNELKQKYIFENILSDNVLNYMDFEEMPYEKITIVRQ